MRPSLDARGVIRLVAIVPAAAIVMRLGGIGITWLPRLPVLAAALVGLHLLRMALRPGAAAHAMRQARVHWFSLALAGVVVLAFVVRLPHFGGDLGRVPLDMDEQRLAASVQDFFATGHLEHDTVENYPGAVFWLFAAASFIGFVVRLLTGLTAPPSALPIELFVASARMANIVVGAAIALVAALIARRLVGRTAAIVAGALVAAAPLSVESAVVRDDAGMVLAVLATVLLSLICAERQGRGWWVAAGVTAGLATGIKYSGMWAMVPVLLALAAVGGVRARLAHGAAAVAAFVAAVAISNHFVWFDFPNFLGQLTTQVAVTGAGHWSATANPAAFYAMVLNRFGPGEALLIAAGVFTVWMLVAGRLEWWIVAAFPLIYVTFMVQRPAQFPRWVFPTLPFVVVLGIAALARMIDAARRWAAARPEPMRRAVATAAAVGAAAALIQPVWSGIVAFSRVVATPTHTLAERWIAAHAAPGDVVLLGEGWLDLSGTALKTRRVPDLGEALSHGFAALDGCDWVIVPRPDFNQPVLQRLVFATRIHAGQRFGDSPGYDFEIFAVPKH